MVLIYKASMARAAAPMIPTAWVAWAAAPVNWETEEEGLTEAEGVVVLTVGIGTGVTDSLTDETTEEATEAAEETTLDTAASEDEAAEGVGEGEAAAELALEGAGVLEGAAVLEAMVRGTPADWQVDSTAAIAFCWSAAEQAPWTQGWTLERSSSPFLQWQAKSVRDEQPSLVRGPTKQESWLFLV